MTNGMVQNKQFSPVSSSFDKLRTNGLARNEGSKYFLPFVLSVRNEQSKYRLPSTGSGQTECCKTNE